MKLELITVPFLELKVNDDAKKPAGSFSGYGSTFGNVDLGKDICVKGCFERSLLEMKGEKVLPSLYWMHDARMPIGDWTSVEEDSTGLKVYGQLWIGKGIPQAEQAYNMLLGTGKKGLSIGYRTKKAGRDDKKNARTLLDVDLPEISVVGQGMNQKAIVDTVKMFTDGIPTIRDLEEILRDAGFSISQAKALLADGYKALCRDGEDEKQKADRELMEALSSLGKSLKA